LPVVRELHERGVRLGVVSNTVLPPTAIDEFLKFEGLIEFLPTRVYSSEVRFMKPDPRIFRIALERLGVEAGRTLFVGDRLDNDVKGPSQVRMRTALFSPPGGKTRGRGKPDHVVQRLSDLLTIVGTERP
jgi:putative hydrolase of the HAD superfamily